MRRDGGRPAGEPSWHDREPVALAAGVAAFALLGLLALAVIRTSEEATDPAQYVSPVGSATTSSSIMTLTTTSSYTVPSAQTSEDSGAPATTSTSPPPEAPDVPDAPPPPTTIFNPYATTTQGNAGHV